MRTDRPTYRNVHRNTLHPYSTGDEVTTANFLSFPRRTFSVPFNTFLRQSFQLPSNRLHWYWQSTHNSSCKSKTTKQQRHYLVYVNRQSTPQQCRYICRQQWREIHLQRLTQITATGYEPSISAGFTNATDLFHINVGPVSDLSSYFLSLSTF